MCRVTSPTVGRERQIEQISLENCVLAALVKELVKVKTTVKI